MVYYEDVLYQEGCTELAELTELDLPRAVLVDLGEQVGELLLRRPEPHRPHDLTQVVCRKELLLLCVKQVKAHLGINVVRTCKIPRSRWSSSVQRNPFHSPIRAKNKNVKNLQAFDLVNSEACRLAYLVKVDALVGVGLGSHGEHSRGTELLR